MTKTTRALFGSISLGSAMLVGGRDVILVASGRDDEVVDLAKTNLSR